LSPYRKVIGQKLFFDVVFHRGVGFGLPKRASRHSDSPKMLSQPVFTSSNHMKSL